MRIEPTAPPRCRAMTLLELLVAIGIIAVLTAILLPALAMVRAASNSVQCKSNLRQLMVAFLCYVPDNDGLMTVNSQAAGPGDTEWWFGWTNNGYPVIDRTLDPTRGLITRYLGSSVANGLQCPNFPYDNSNFVPKFAVHAADYGLNEYLCPLSSSKTAYRPAQVKYPITTVVFADGLQKDGLPPGGPTGFYEAFYLGIDKVGSPYGGFVHWRHPGRSANVAYLDGHIDQVQAQTGYPVTTISGCPVGNLTSGDVSATSPYGSIPP
jgi:prepilin-type processing-associated H-X9-DG protein/prepilin-type N-terminal cleavage/methylation domain-containing protein